MKNLNSNKYKNTSYIFTNKVMNMNCIFINKINMEDKFKVVSRAINESNILNELYINDYIISNIYNLNTNDKSSFRNIYNKLKIRIFENKFRKILRKIKNENNNYYVFSNTIKEDKNITKYLSELLASLNFSEYIYQGEFEKNIEKHIERYACENKKQIKDIKCLLLTNILGKIDIELLSRLIVSYKTINIYSLSVPKKNDLNIINDFNLKEGTTISIMNNTKKTYKDYDVAIYIHGSKTEFKKLRFNSLTLHLDINNFELDDFDNNYVRIKDLIKNNKIIETVVNRLYKNYGKNTVASIIAKIV